MFPLTFLEREQILISRAQSNRVSSSGLIVKALLDGTGFYTLFSMLSILTRLTQLASHNF